MKYSVFYKSFKNSTQNIKLPTEKTDTRTPPHVEIVLMFTKTFGQLCFAAGQIAFGEFLKSEYSEENILFWLACEEHKNIKKTPEMISSANRIYTEFVQTEAPRQVERK